MLSRNKPELFAHQKEEHEGFVRKEIKKTRDYDIDWGGIISSLSLTTSIGIFGTGIVLKLVKTIEFVLPKVTVKLPSLTLDDIFLMLGFIALLPWLAITIYRKFYSKEDKESDK